MLDVKCYCRYCRSYCPPNTHTTSAHTYPYTNPFSLSHPPSQAIKKVQTLHSVRSAPQHIS